MSTAPASSSALAPHTKPRVLHFVTGGFSGATQVALDLLQAHRAGNTFDAMLALREKRQTPHERVAELQAQGVNVTVVPGWSHAATVWQLAKLCRAYRPDILVAHGFSDHIWGRYAGLLAHVPHLVHVEHNSRERYTWWRLRQSLWLSQRTDAIVGCSEGVRGNLLRLGFPADKTMAIPNGIEVSPYRDALSRPLASRERAILMAARFARQKDHTTLLHAMALLKQRGLVVPLYLAGGGKSSYQDAAVALAQQLGLDEQVHFLGHTSNMPELLMSKQICVLSSHYEGMALSLIEGMAAGCAVVGSRVPGVEELIRSGSNGLLSEHANAQSLADALAQLLEHPEQAAELARQAHLDALQHHTRSLMLSRYEALFLHLLNKAHPPSKP